MSEASRARNTAPARNPVILGVRKGGRSARVVSNVLEAALQELIARGYAGLSMESVAARAGVNKTTVYRRWPTKADLIQDAIVDRAQRQPVPPETGDLRADVIAALQQMGTFAHSPQGRGLMLAMQAAATNPEVAAMARSLRARKDSLVHRIISRGIKDGELPLGTDAHLVQLMLTSAMRHSVLVNEDVLPTSIYGRMVDMVLDGVRNGGGAKVRRAR